MVHIPTAEAQLEVLGRGVVELQPKAAFMEALGTSHARKTPLRIKAGFDPTAPDLHLGHLVLIEKMAQFQRMGHEVIFLIGDYTALIGDPTGQNSMRPPLTESEIEANAATYTEQVFKVLDRDKTRVEWNSRWLARLSFSDVVKLASKYNVGRMLERRDFKQRFEQNKQIAVHEFLYPLMQAYDSVALEADVELGGQDQIFNLLVGRHIMETYGLKPQSVMTVGLLVGLDGVEKMSKSKGNHIGITETSENVFGKVMSISDETMWLWYPMLTDLEPDSKTEDPLEAKKKLAVEVVSRTHGLQEANDIRAWWEAGRPPRTLNTVRVPSGPLYQVVFASGLAKSGKDARRKIEQGGVSLEGARHTDAAFAVSPGTYLLRVGKKSMAKLVVEEEGL